MPRREFSYSLSKILVGLYAAVFVFAFGVSAFAPLDTWVRLPALVLVLLGLVSVGRQLLQLKALGKIRIKEGGALELLFEQDFFDKHRLRKGGLSKENKPAELRSKGAVSDTWRSVEILGQVVVSPYLLAFRCRTLSPPRQTYSILIPPDSIDADSHRLLRVFFLHGATFTEQ